MVEPSDWFVFLIGGPSGVGKTTVAHQVAKRLGASWLQVDDLALALVRGGLPIPDADSVPKFDAPGGVLQRARALTPAIEVVIEHHVDLRDRVVIEGDAILPSLLARPSVSVRSDRIRAVLLYEADETVLLENMESRMRGVFTPAHAHKNVLYGEWLKAEAELNAVPVINSRPRHDLVERIIETIDIDQR